MSTCLFRKHRLLCGLLLFCLCATPAGAADALEQGDTGTIRGRQYVIKTLHTLPFVDSSYATRMIWQKHDDPRLRALREDLRLDNVLLKGATEFERQVHLMEFVNDLWHFGDPTNLKMTFSPARIIEHNKQEQRFYCEQYACIMAGCAASVGWVYRLVSHDNHTWGEIWSNQYGKWVYLDPTGNRWVPGSDGVPLSTSEVRLKTFTTEAPFPIRTGTSTRESTWPGDKRFAVIGYHPNTDLMDAAFDYEKMYVIRDEYSGKKQDVRGKGDPVTDSLVAPNFPVNQAALFLTPARDGISVHIRTMTPNFKTFRCKADDDLWRNCGDTFIWKLHGGANVLLVKSVNQFEVDGPASKVEVTVDGEAEDNLPHAYLGSPASEEESKIAGMPGLAPVKTAGELDPQPFTEELKEEWISMWYKPGHWIEWNVLAPEAGEYAMTLYYLTTYHPQRELRVNGAVVPGLEAFILPSTGDWRTWKQGTLPIEVNLQEGQNTLRLTSLDNTYAWLRQIVLSGNGHSIRLGPFDFAREGGGQVQKTFVPHNGSFYGWNDKDHWLKWKAQVPAAGEYDIYLRMAGLEDAKRDMQVNGNPIAADSPTIAPTGGWQVWTEIPFGKAHLKAGENAVRMDNVNGTPMNLNAIRFVNTEGQEIFVNAIDFVAEGGGKVKLRR